MTLITFLLYSQSSPLAPIMSLLGLAIALIWLFTRNARKAKKDKVKSEDEKNKMQ